MLTCGRLQMCLEYMILDIHYHIPYVFGKVPTPVRADGSGKCFKKYKEIEHEKSLYVFWESQFGKFPSMTANVDVITQT